MLTFDQRLKVIAMVSIVNFVHCSAIEKSFLEVE
jgi:hypothetical protein